MTRGPVNVGTVAGMVVAIGVVVDAAMDFGRSVRSGAGEGASVCLKMRSQGSQNWLQRGYGGSPVDYAWCKV